MRVLITGGTGFIGIKLCRYLMDRGDELVVLTRNPSKVMEGVVAIKAINELASHEYFDAVINLAGEPIADKKWSVAQQQTIRNSRINTTKELVGFMSRALDRPKVFISGSAIGFYGDGIDDTGLTEDDKVDDYSFSRKLCVEWEREARKANSLDIRTCLLRIGIVLGAGGGALAKMLPPFKLGLGGKIGTGQQWMSWVHIDDLVGLIAFCLDHEALKGAVNGTAPNPVTNAQFSQSLGRVLGRPVWFKVPAFAIKWQMGQMGDELLLGGKKILPQKALQAGFCFQYDDVDSALRAVL